MLAQLPSQPDNSFTHYALLVLAWVITTTISGWSGYRWGLRSQRIAREFAANDAIATRRRDFLNLVIEIKTRITDDGDAIGKWVFDIKENLLALNTAFAKIAHELNGDDKIRIRSAIAGLTQFSRMEHEDIYEQQQELWEALNKFPSV
jgi:hypothetical protein